MNIESAAVPDTPFQACLNHALARAQGWVPRWLDQLHDALREREALEPLPRERQGFAVARVALVEFRARLSERFSLELAHSLRVAGDAFSVNQYLSTTTAPLDPASEALALMDDSQMQASVELSRVYQTVNGIVDDELVAFNARLARAQGHSTVGGQTHPLHPEPVVGALMRAVRRLHIDDAVRVRWLQAGAVPLGMELKALYQELTSLLDRLGVKPARYAVAPVGEHRPAAAAPARAEAVVASARVGSQPVITLEQLHELLLGGLGAVAGGERSSRAMLQTLAGEVVNLMLKPVAEDRRLLHPVREMLLSCKPMLLQLAKDDPRFFADQGNPVRRLIDLILRQSQAFKHEYDDGFAEFAQRVNQMLKALRQPGPDLEERLGRLASRFEEDADARSAASSVGTLLSQVPPVQRRQVARGVVAEMESHRDFARAPGVVRRFLSGPWADVVAEARLMQAAADGEPMALAAAQYMAVLPDLLWSSQVALASQDRQRLVQVAPEVMRTLRDGLDLIDFPREDAQAFFQALMGLHEAAYRAHRVVADEPETLAPDTETLSPAESVVADQQAFGDTLPAPMEAEDPFPYPARTPLEVGSWIELEEQGLPLRCQLSWVSLHGTMFLFSAPGKRSISLTLRGLERLQTLGRLRVVAGPEDEIDTVREEWAPDPFAFEVDRGQPGLRPRA